MEKEKEQEIRKLVNVLRRTARLAAQAGWGWACGAQSQEHTAQYCVQQYNRIFDRLKEIDPSVATVFGPLAEDTPLEVVIIACRQLAAYYEEDLEATEEGRRHRHRDWGSFYETAYEAGPFKILFGRGFKDLEELGKIIRECMPPWMRGEEPRSQSEEPKPSPGSEPAPDAKA
ncbi:MAG: hypothetical protein HY314_01130 [Acidobacteria bacterium]|nr:hypothetical protein [Acidobacteriota bacterium]